MKFAFIRAEKASFPVAAMCRLLGVTRQGFYASQTRPPSKRVLSDAALCVAAQEIFNASDATYGSPRVRVELHKRGVRPSKRRVERVMRSLGLTPIAPRRHCKTTMRDLTQPAAPNLLARDFTATRPNERWVTDITYVWTASGWVYLAAILDLFSRSVVGWAVDTTLSTRLPLAALESAIKRRRPEAGLVHHSDRGCQYTSVDYRATLQSLGISVSMSRKGNCWDNAVAESFFATLKRELIHRKHWQSCLEVRTAVFGYIETFYNRRRLHSALNYKTPAEVEGDFAKAA